MVKIQVMLQLRYNIAHGLVTAAQNAPSARKVTGGLPWREAASVMLVSPTPLQESSGNGGSADSGAEGASSTPVKEKPHFLVTQRSKTSGSFSNILCFPGGNACQADSDPQWIHRFNVSSGVFVEKGVNFIHPHGELPGIYAADKKSGPGMPDTLPKTIALRLTAIRETFEETGVLLCRTFEKETWKKGIGQESRLGLGNTANVYEIEDPNELQEWQAKVREDAAQFQKLCNTYGCVPDLDALVEWNDWLTPNCFGMQRYDTMFYLALVPQSYPLYICPDEVESASWLTADQVLSDCEERKCKMITPQIYELSRLRSSSIKKISQLMKIRLKLGLARWCPAYIRAKDGYLSVFPGDDLYPQDIRIEVFEPISSIDSTLDELRDTTFHHHRIEYRSEFDFRVVIKNYREKSGHVYLDM